MKFSTGLFTFLSNALFAAATYHWDVARIGTVDSFKWLPPFPGDGTPLNGYTSCDSKAFFNATQYKYIDLNEVPPAGLFPWAPSIRSLFNSRAYPGSWHGVNFKGDDREIVLIEYKDVPELAQNWIEEQLKDPQMKAKRFMTVLGKPDSEGKVPQASELDKLKPEDKLFMFAPGELYTFLPLWVAKGAKCEDKLKNLDNYVAPQVDGEGVLAWAETLTRPNRDLGKRDVSFEVDARFVVETEEGRAARLFWEKAHAMGRRAERKRVREERQGKRELRQAQRADKDEL
ncbi:hypothetical protein jhhlp_007786 [Lomentospora prolificans]|uniref:Uncharacterized protein n=1 Tax=Lomentospora prolificans TaxID=41688 RepID=A0A2N3N0J9_9PEZI|nr:hypothetical protein jhhlp_007786 [Lomentospora prolificans]